MNTNKENIISAIAQGVITGVNSPSTRATASDARTIIDAVERSTAPVVAHITNTEPWYQSRVTLGAILAAAAGLLGVFGYAFPEDVQGKVVDLIVALAPVIGGILALHGRWVAKKPLGK
ncbi:hypothetical protein HRR99_03380 [Agrobacterium vaccinii]|uniref:hypothetical protein n=1 Tax=Agrobacterium vaccinii TaxID=2735528 RepID=UPI001E449385|nr:hypothetical protein [Agrobacterium vaccinii]UHS60628.1 hypothetical protein HRR99_03380 [Agrobacterium vaccinii]